jgi:hypothetical protein
MTTEMIIALVALGIVVLLALLVAVPKLVLHMMKRPLESRIGEVYGEHDVLLKDLEVNSLGLESNGVFQLRGNGALVLTRTQLHFFQFLPRREVKIPLEVITEISFTRSHLGKAMVNKLLKVRFARDGQADSIAWYVRDPDAWKERIEEVRTALLSH